MELNVNNAQCIKYIEDIGGWRVYNICTDAQSFIPWGVGHWFLFLLVCAILSTIFWVFWKIITVVRGA